MADAAFSFAQGNLAKLCALPKYVLSIPVSWLVPRAADRWVFGSGAGVGEGALALADELRREDPDARIRWLVANEAEAGRARAAGFEPVFRVGWRGFWETLRARTVVVTHGLGDANRFGLFGARVVQLWHGAPLKRLHLDSAVTTQVRGPRPLRALLRRMYRVGSDRITLFVVGSETAAARIVSAFRISPERVRVLGDPRDDALAMQAQDPARARAARDAVRALLGLPAERSVTADAATARERLVLYAPTWRDGDPDPAVPSATEAAAIHAWAGRANARLMLRSHPLGAGAYAAVLGERVHEFGSDLARDVTPHLGAFDAVITDYSSIAIDFALLERPIVWFAPDLEQYEATRGLYEPLELTSGGAVARTWAETLARLDAALPAGDAHEESVAQASALAHRFHAFPQGGAAARVLAALRQPGSNVVSLAAAPSTPTVFFESFYGRQVSCNPLAIDGEIARRHPGARRFWSVTSPDQAVPEGATAVVEGSPQWHRARGEASLLVVNDWLRHGFSRRRGQTVLQTWHGTMLKHLALGRPGVSLRTNLAIRRESRRWSIMLSQNPHSSSQFRSSYAFRGTILETGYPRDDRLARSLLSEAPGADAYTELRRDPAVVRAAREALGVDPAARVLAYAPTWRDAGTALVDVLDVARLAEELGPDWVVVARGHTRTHAFGSYAGVVDASRHPDVNDVILAADLLVTDYSSIMFDASVARVPLVFLVPDLAAYRDTERGFTFDFTGTAPGPLVTQRSDVVRLATELAADGDQAQWVRESAPRASLWREKFNPHDDGHAAERVVRELERRGILPAAH
ncbi:MULTISPECIES: CDP-glycerol glycerophosphotransferase family protein [unclassified Leucobacter]|uniref:CDP-glycerol glycerophosphotransferase family protein n=1 Tax=unclassified Leucobacter TaxID=2621730 RepID=UPI00165DF10A|nr:CDP-glycerol glycerophosphotransferase family protein [Leucobacter sp. CX169]MBC9928017.1 CDP-glycerol glycerophosphotransferase family protein [Leucobacter sp. cx-169]